MAVATLEQTIPLQSLRRIVVTHLTPKRLPSLRALLERKQAAGGPLDIHLSNPALQLLRSSLGELPALLPLLPANASQLLPSQKYIGKLPSCLPACELLAIGKLANTLWQAFKSAVSPVRATGRSRTPPQSGTNCALSNTILNLAA